MLRRQQLAKCVIQHNQGRNKTQQRSSTFSTMQMKSEVLSTKFILYLIFIIIFLCFLFTLLYFNFSVIPFLAFCDIFHYEWRTEATNGEGHINRGCVPINPCDVHLTMLPRLLDQSSMAVQSLGILWNTGECAMNSTLDLARPHLKVARCKHHQSCRRLDISGTH